MVSPPAGFARIAGAITFPACVLLSGITPPASRQLFADNYNRPAPAAPGRKPSLKILYAGMPLSGRTFVLRTRAGAFALSSWQVKNDGSAPLPAGLSVRLYFSDSIGGSARPLIWEQLPSTDPAYPVEFLWKSRGTVNPGETRDLPDFENRGPGLVRSVRGKLVVSVAAGAAAEAFFLIRPVN